MKMAPGTSSMLRARRRDVNVKPNRVLDRSSSRGMIYENEELRLRTININAEVERSQGDIKKLRRENEQLKREIWQLREEYDRLEAVLKEKQQSEEQEESEDEGDEDEDEENEEENKEESEEKENADQENAQNQWKAGNIRKTFDNLSIVEEVPEESPENVSNTNPAQTVKFVPGPTHPTHYHAAPNSNKSPPMPPPSPPPAQKLESDPYSNPAFRGVPVSRGTNPFLQPPPMQPTCHCCQVPFKVEPVRSAEEIGNRAHQLKTDSVNGDSHGGGGRDTGEGGPVPVRGSDVFLESDQLDCLANCTSLGHKLNSAFSGPGYYPLPRHLINGVVQEVKYSATPTSQAEGSRTQVHGEIVTTILTRRQSFQAKVDSQAGAEVRNDEANPFQCTPFSESESTQFLRLNSVQPFTLTFQTQQFPNITVHEIIDSLLGQLSSDLQSSLKGVRMVGNSCFVSFSRQADMERVLATVINIKEQPVQFSDASIGASVLCLSGVPHHIPDQAIDSILSKYGCLVGQVERRVYKGIDIGERFVRLRAKLAIPRYISICGHSIKIRVLHDEEVNNLSISRRRSFRSQLNIRLKIPSENLLESTESLNASPSMNDSQTSLGVLRVHLTPPIPPLPSDPSENNFNVIPQSSGAVSHSCCNASDSDVRTIPTQQFRPSGSLENRHSSQNIHHSLPDFVSSNVVASPPNPYFFTYPVSNAAQSDSHFFHKACSKVVSDPGTLSLERNETKDLKSRNMKSRQTPLANYSTDCFQFPIGPANHGKETQDSPAVGNQTPPSSGDKKTCSSDKDQDSEREKGQGEKGKETKKKAKKGKQGKSQNKLAERKPGPGVGECSQSSSSGQDSPSKSRRKLSVNFKRDGLGGATVPSPVFRTASFERHDGPLEVVGTCSEFERSNSESSSRFGSTNNPRKMSSTGREKAKVPWCGCWGNGCC